MTDINVSTQYISLHNLFSKTFQWKSWPILQFVITRLSRFHLHFIYLVGTLFKQLENVLNLKSINSSGAKRTEAV